MEAWQKVWATEVTWAEGAWRLPDSRVIDRPDWYQITTPERPLVIYNGVYRSVMPEAEADSIIDRVIEEYRTLSLPFRWTVGPSAQPSDLAERLQRRGMVEFARTLGMVIRSDAPMPVTRSGITVEQVTAETVLDWAKASGGGWGMPEQYLEGYAADSLGHIERLGDQIAYVLARVDGEPAGAAIVHYVQGIGWLKGTSVRPEFRRRGVYQAMVAWRLAHMQQRGVEWAAIQATIGTSEPICRALGFETVCHIDLYCTPDA